MSKLKKAGIGLGIFLGILGALLLFLRALLPKGRGVDFYIPKVGKGFYMLRLDKDFYVPSIRKFR